MGSLISSLAILFVLNPSNYLAIAAPVDSLTDFQDMSSIDLSQAHNLTSAKEPTEAPGNAGNRAASLARLSRSVMISFPPHRDLSFSDASDAVASLHAVNLVSSLAIESNSGDSLCNTIGWQGRYLSYMCTKDKAGNFRGDWFYGQYFDSLKYNIIARSERCGEPEGWPGKSKQEPPKRPQDKPISAQGRGYGLDGNIREQLHGRSPPTFPQDNANGRPPPVSCISGRVREQPRLLDRKRKEDFRSRLRSPFDRKAGYGGGSDQRDVRARECQCNIPGGAVPGSCPWTTPPSRNEHRNVDRVPPARPGNMVRLPAVPDDGRRFDQVPARHGNAAEGRGSRDRFRHARHEGCQPRERSWGDYGPAGSRTSDRFLHARRGGYVGGDEQPPAAAQPRWSPSYDRDVAFRELVARSEELMEEKWLDDLHPGRALGLAELQRYHRVMERKRRRGLVKKVI
ncbi:hypothetical protein MBM_08988 [Drepanopeziza brunnea f. sp. 'multigermtubi' MB_m1]|uniref:Uncharacterized protein n=1 Tax=Marssonina brunnea f. sp. multigermtubi (strain MB_m1) TaxID=1072389 RepID=K1XK10_MARBU|nr:uncharacterized protein MBM_08988 [Drepanopeziza brunnea f. sp. 'multigermtubi' MB_m1]EKD12759.1 hypothetical protein MBM_08988 [Drepanopeziza brunnea f. sp. 'multigermtubi' MB_m1]